MAVCCWCQSALEAIPQKEGRVFLCPTPECRQRQLLWSMRATETEYLYLPTPRQTQFHEMPQRHVLFGGAAGPGKSFALRWDAYRRCLTVPRYKALLMRRTYPELEKTHMRDASHEAPRFGAKFVPSEYIVRFQNGSFLEFGHCENDQAVNKYLSTEYDWMGFDELVSFPPDTALELMTRARTVKPGVSAMIRAGSNPGGVGALWVLDFFVDRTPDPERFPRYNPAHWAFVPATLDDNPYLDPTYGDDTLGNLSDARFRQLRFGDWRVFEGQFFSKWDERIHLNELAINPSLVTWFCSLDWGYAAPGCCLWWACLADGHYLIVDEYKFKETTVKDVADGIKRKSRELGLTRVPRTWADPAIWQRTGQVGEAIGETFQRWGVPVVKSNNDRLNGWQRVQEMLRVAPDGRPWLQIHPRCRYLTRTLPAAVRDDTEPEDVDTACDDHAVDALRYGAMSRGRFVDRTPPTVYSDLQVGGMIQKLRQPARRVLGESSVRRRVA